MIKINYKLFDLKDITKLNQIQVNKLMRLWFIYGNNGKKHDDNQHKWIQKIIESHVDEYEFWGNRISKECKEEVYKVLSNFQ